jgi:hypothetical protein
MTSEMCILARVYLQYIIVPYFHEQIKAIGRIGREFFAISNLGLWGRCPHTPTRGFAPWSRCGSVTTRLCPPLAAIHYRVAASLPYQNPFCKKGSGLPKTFDKHIYLRFLGIPKDLLQKVLWWGAGVKPLPDKPKFVNQSSTKKPAPLPCDRGAVLSYHAIGIIMFPSEERPRCDSPCPQCLCLDWPE